MIDGTKTSFRKMVFAVKIAKIGIIVGFAVVALVVL
jgi:hypothetical protein